MRFSIIIPTYNEQGFIQRLIHHLQKVAIGINYEIIVCDGGSTDITVKIAESCGVIVLNSPTKGRAGQMNYAAKVATGDILYFVHADCLPPANCFSAIQSSVSAGFDAGCFRYRFESERFLLKINTYFTRFSGLIYRGGDQTLYIKKSTFNLIQGFNERFIIMEDYELVRRLRKKHQFQIIPEYAIVSSRKYDKNNWIKVNFANTVAMVMFLSGVASPQRIKSTYHGIIKHPKDE